MSHGLDPLPVPIPDSIPEELVATYGPEARVAVRSRRSWRFRQVARARGWFAAHDVWYLAATALLWIVIVAGFGGAVTLAAARWPVPTIDGGALLAAAAASSAITVWVLHRREARRLRRLRRPRAGEPPRILL